jgi:transcriptional regulator with XRE-family HTH domain
MTYMTLGEKIKFRRHVLGLSQAELAKKSGVGQSYISELENGKFNPTSKTLAALAGPLKCTTDYLIFDGKKAG